MTWPASLALASILARLERRRVAIAIVSSAMLAFALWARVGAIPPDLLADGAARSAVVVDRRGVPLYEALSDDGTRGVALTADALPPALVSATLAAEDRRFWSHPGVDPVAMLRALARDAVELRAAEGGSTISQQVAKLLLSRRAPNRHRGLTAKIQEAILALRLEHRFSKREILARYLNLAAYGNQISGAERASRAYFGCAASMLTPAQAAFLAGLPQRPSGFNPYRSRQAAVARQQAVLRRMAAAGALAPEQLREAQSERLVFARQAPPFGAPHLVEMALRAAGDPRPARIVTTIDGELQADVAGIIRSQRATLTAHGAANVAVVVLENATGEWLAWEGSGNYFDREHGGTINGPSVPRQPGSALKPFTYALAFERGLSPSSVLADVPSSFPTAESGILYSPRNYDGRYRGPLLARRALAGSENVPAVALASEVGVPNLLRFLLRAGLTTFDRNASYYGLGITLGNAEVKLSELVAAYAAFARGGEWIAPAFLAGSGQRETRALVGPRTAFWITDVLSDPQAREYIFGRGGSLEFPFPVAVKTGTSQAYHDNWTIGYSRHVTVGVWVGNFDRTPLRNSSGVTGAAPIFHAVMLAAERRAPVHPGDPGAANADAVAPGPDVAVRRGEICALSGMTANRWCPTRLREWVATDASPLPCSWHHLTDDGLLTFVPAAYQFGAGTGNTGPQVMLAGARPPLNAGNQRPARKESLKIASPPDGATYLIDPTLRREFQALPLRAQTPADVVEWIVDGRSLGSMEAARPASWPLAPGRHTFVARDTQGREARATVVVR